MEATLSLEEQTTRPIMSKQEWFTQVKSLLQFMGIGGPLGLGPHGESTFKPPEPEPTFRTREELTAYKQQTIKSEMDSVKVFANKPFNDTIRRTMQDYYSGSFDMQNGKCWQEITPEQLGVYAQLFNDRKISIGTYSYREADGKDFHKSKFLETALAGARTQVESGVGFYDVMSMLDESKPSINQATSPGEMKLLLVLAENLGINLNLDRTISNLDDLKKTAVTQMQDQLRQVINPTPDQPLVKRRVVLMANDFQVGDKTGQGQKFTSFENTVKTQFVETGLLGVLHIATPQEKPIGSSQPTSVPIPTPA